MVHGKLELEAWVETAGSVEEGMILSWMCGDEGGILGWNFSSFSFGVLAATWHDCCLSSAAPLFC
jgi:hypothetical protein